jgi:hypothetical protein
MVKFHIFRPIFMKHAKIVFVFEGYFYRKNVNVNMIKYLIEIKL